MLSPNVVVNLVHHAVAVAIRGQPAARGAETISPNDVVRRVYDTGQTFQEVQNAFCRIVDETNGDELARYTLAGGGAYTAQIMAKVHRTGTNWTMTAIGTPANGRTFQDLMPAILPHL